MKVKPLSGHKNRRLKTIQLMLKVVDDFNKGMEIEYIAIRYKKSPARIYQLLEIAREFKSDKLVEL